MSLNIRQWKDSRYLPNLFAILGMLTYHYMWFMEYPFFFSREASAAIWGMSLLAILSVLPWGSWRIGVIFWALAACCLFYVNALKSELMGFPLTEMDFMIVWGNPVGFLDAIGIPRYVQLLMVAAIPALLIAAGIYLWRKKRDDRIDRQYSPLYIRTGLMLCVAFLFGNFYSDYGKHVYDNRPLILGPGCSWWEPLCLIQASNRLGTLGFVAYTHEEAKRKPAIFKFSSDASTTSGNALVLTQAMAHRFLVNRDAQWSNPNIVFILGESTFDPKAVFHIEGEDFSLFSPPKGRNGGLMHVSPVGGGTWRTEFETITGLDSRFFGVMGDYTHLTLAPWVKDSYAVHLGKRGYSTGAFYPVSGTFYSARKAYADYGFHTFQDADDLGLEKDWVKFSDEQMAEVVSKKLPEDSQQPFFRYVVLLENHSPHHCKGEHAGTTRIRFKEPDKAKDCALQEYARRLESTSRGFEKLVTRLQEIETKTGRPYIAVIFGDHQPMSFVTAAYKSNRTALSPQHTFYQVAASRRVVLPDIKTTFHATLLPTLVSSITAKTEQEIFLPENLHLFEACGAVAEPSACSLLGRVLPAYKRYIDL